MALSVFNQNYRISSFSLGLHYIMGVSGDTRSAGAVASKASVALHCCIVALLHCCIVASKANVALHCCIVALLHPKPVQSFVI